MKKRKIRISFSSKYYLLFFRSKHAKSIYAKATKVPTINSTSRVYTCTHAHISLGTFDLYIRSKEQRESISNFTFLFSSVFLYPFFNVFQCYFLYKRKKSWKGGWRKSICSTGPAWYALEGDKTRIESCVVCKFGHTLVTRENVLYGAKCREINVYWLRKWQYRTINMHVFQAFCTLCKK